MYVYNYIFYSKLNWICDSMRHWWNQLAWLFAVVITRCSINFSGCLRSRRWCLNRTPVFRFQPHVVAYVIRASCTLMSRVALYLPTAASPNCINNIKTQMVSNLSVHAALYIDSITLSISLLEVLRRTNGIEVTEV